MVTEIQYTNIKRVLDNLLDHPLLKDLNLEQVVRYTIRFISLHGMPKFYQDKIDNVKIHEFRGLLPCDLISIIQVKDMDTHVCLRSMTDTFTPALRPEPPFHPSHPEPPMPPPPPGSPEHPEPPMDAVPMDKHKPWYIPPMKRHGGEPAFKTQGRCIFTSFPEGMVQVAYKGIPVDAEGFPLLIDNETYLACLEAYIKKQVFTVKFDTGKIKSDVLQNAKNDYYLLAAELSSEFQIPSVSEMESITRYYNSLIPRVVEFDRGFRNLGNREYLWNH